MQIIHTVKELASTLEPYRAEGKSIGLVPTMGALHEGHASLVRLCVRENDVTVVSIFVNPTQFNDKKDLATYPRTLEKDVSLLEKENATIAFAPSIKEMYPEPDTRQFSYPPIDTVMEGAYRPGHFNGVCQIVSKLFMIAAPRKAYFGEKDYQQIAVIRAMVKDLELPVEIVPCPVVRQADGLARSSRNALLTEAERKTAAKIAQTLTASLEFAKSHTVSETQQRVVEALNAVDGLNVQYYEIVDGDTLQAVDSWDASPSIVGCITVFCGHVPVRLIDHIRYK